MVGSGSLEVARGMGLVCGLVHVARANHELLRRSACCAPGQCRSRATRAVLTLHAEQGRQSAVIGQTAGRNRWGDRRVTASGR